MIINRQNEVLERMKTHPPSEIDAEMNLGAIAYENVHDPVFHEWLKLDPVRRREAWRERYVFYSCACCLGAYFGERLKHDFDGTNAFVVDVVGNIAYLAEGRVSFTEEWFKSIDRLVGDFINLNFIAEARSLVAIGLRTGIKKYRGLALSLSVNAAYLDALIGRTEKAAKVAIRLVQSPYLLPNRRELPALCQRLFYILAAGNHLREYRLVLWTGVSLLQSSYALRDTFSAQIAKTYRGTLRALIASDVPLKFRIPYLLSNLARFMSTVPIFRWMGLDKPVRWGNLALLFIFEFFFIRKNELFREANRLALGNSLPPKPKIYERLKSKLFERRTPRVLVTRAMGGIGDILMMTPGLRALSIKYPNAQIDFAIPKSFHSVVDGLPGVRLLDIDEETISLNAYKRWINLTDCPAGRAESRQYPNVGRNRIESFAKAIGISKWRLKLGIGFVPYYQINAQERDWAHDRMKELNPNNLPVIGIQPFSADSYKNWPYMQQLANNLAQTHCILIFHHETLIGFEGHNIYKIIEPIRRTIGLVSMCDQLVVVDSSFLHFSAPLEIPTVAIFGPTSGKVFCRYYTNVRYLAPRKPDYPCYPCWRNEHKPCHLTNSRKSICLQSISVGKVIDELKLETRNLKMKDPLTKLISWIRYGRE